jgi:hypothetical protein
MEVTVHSRLLQIVLVSSFAVAIAGGNVAAYAEGPGSGGDEHCVVHVVDQLASGELVLSEPRCFVSLHDALRYAGEGPVERLSPIGGGAGFSGPIAAATLATFTLGIHFDGFNGTGSSITVVGSSCTGGWWNTGATWANRISSSYNGCARLRHYDLPNKGGASQDTFGAGTTDNLSTLNNKAESVSYHSS